MLGRQASDALAYFSDGTNSNAATFPSQQTPLAPARFSLLKRPRQKDRLYPAAKRQTRAQFQFYHQPDTFSISDLLACCGGNMGSARQGLIASGNGSPERSETPLPKSLGESKDAYS